MSLTSPQRELLTSVCDLAARQPGEDFSLALLPLPGSVWPPASRRKVADELRDAGLLVMVSPWVRISPAGWQALRRTPPSPATRPAAAPAEPSVPTSREQVLAALTAGEWRSVPELAKATGLTYHVIGPVVSALVRKGEIECQDPTPANGMRKRYRLASGAIVPPALPEPTPPEAPVRHATSDAARDVLWDALQPDADRDGLTVLGLAEMAAEELEGHRRVASQVVAWLDEQGVPPGRLTDRLACCCKVPPQRPETGAAFADEATYAAMGSQGLTIEGACARVRQDATDELRCAFEAPTGTTWNGLLALASASTYATADRAREVLWEALKSEVDRDGLTVFDLAEMAAERLEALAAGQGEAARLMEILRDVNQVLTDAGAPDVGTVERVRWLHGEWTSALSRDDSHEPEFGKDYYAEQLWEALGSGPLEGLGWDQLLDVVRDRSRPLHLQLDDEIIRHRHALRALESAQSVLAGGDA